MFQKPAFGSNTTTGFGSFNAGASTTSPFGGFKTNTGTSAFGAPPAFGATPAAQPTTGGGLFGASSTSGGLFGASTSTAPAPAFGSSGGFGFAANQSTGGGLFGANTTGGGLFANTQQNNAFAAKPAGFGFGSGTTATPSGGGLFGATPSTGTTLFGQQNNTMGGGGLFGNTTGAFGQQQASGTEHVKFNPVVGSDVIVKSGHSQTINIKHHCITCMKEYEGKSLEELRLEDYTAGRKGQAGATGGVFGFQQPAENKPLFPTSSFGQPATTNAPSVFGAGAIGTTGGFGQNSSFSFGGNTANTANSLFGANKPAFGATSTAGTGLFGTTTTQAQAPAFGANTSTFGGFGTAQAQPTGGLFGAKPATSTFGTTNTSFGGFGTAAGGATGGLFGAAKPATNAQPFAAPTTGSAFGTLGGGFGTNTSTSGGLFGANNTFGKPATTQPAFGFNTQPTGLGAGLGTNTFQNKPAGGFGTLGGGGLFSQPAQTNTFKTGLEGGLGGGIFGNNTSILGGSGLGMGGLGANNSSIANNSLSGAAPGNVHEQIRTLAALTYGDSPLFKDLKPETTAASENALKPTNPAAVKAVLDSHSNSYRITSPQQPIKLSVRARSSLAQDKKSLFDGLEESDASLEDKLSLKPSKKRLVLRQNQRQSEANVSMKQTAQNNRSVEEQSQRTPSLQQHNFAHQQETREERVDARELAQSYQQNNSNLEVSSDRHGSWLSGSRVSWNDKENPIGNEPTPRLYPNLDKELPAQVSERRASWLTTKPLRKPLVTQPDSVENSVRDLGLHKEPQNEPKNKLLDKENVDDLSVSEEENVSPRDCPPHPTGVKLSRPGYYTIPSLDEMINFLRPDNSCVVPHLTIGRKNYGNVYYDCEVDVAGLDLDSLVHFLNKEVIVYPEDCDKPAVGEGLNRRAIVTLDRIWPRDKTEKRPITDPDRLLKMDYEGKLRRVCDKHDTKFIEYRPQTGSWVFRVEHFSKYGLTDSDEEDEPTPEVLKRQLVTQSLQRNAAPPPAPLSKPLVSMPSLGLGGAGLMPEDNLYAMQQTSLNLLNGAGKSSFKAFDMDTAEDNAESQSLYQDSHRGFNVKSPTSELARLEHRHSHSVQLMKASLYVDTDMEEENMSVSTGDQLVPLLPPARSPHVVETLTASTDIPQLQVHSGEESQMRPLIVRPQKIILKYHRKIPPFKETIAGRLDASCLSDMSVCRSRHSRAGFGVGGRVAFPTTYDALNKLPQSSQLCDIGSYLMGRTENDWSEPVVATMAIGQPDPNTSIKETLTKHMGTLLKYSATVSGGLCPLRSMKSAPAQRRAALAELARHAGEATGDVQFGVSNTYCLEVWKLCEALWGADLHNDGVPATDELSIVNRYRSFVDWLSSAVKVNTDRELSRPCRGEPEDESDGHSYRIWWLLNGGRVVAACKLAADSGDYNMAAIIAQGAGDPAFRSLLSRQLTLWRECGADSLISGYRLATIQLVAGSCPDQLVDEHWLTVLHDTARYLVPQVATLEGIVSKYESLLSTNNSEAGDDSSRFQRPTPGYLSEYDVTVSNPSRSREVFDLRYELIRARAFNTRPKLQPAAYTADPLDYSLCFLLGVWFGIPSPESVTGMADQLETYGLWHLAVQALTYHPDDNVRAHLIKGVLSRNAPAVADSDEISQRIQLVKELGPPEQWLLAAQACRAKYHHMPLVEADHLIGAGEFNAAHKVLLDELLPEAVLADDLHSIAPLLEKLSEAAARHEVSGWESGGQALHQYMKICDQIRSMAVDSDSEAAEVTRHSVLRQLEALRPNAVLSSLQHNTARVRCARASLGARLVQLSRCCAAPPRRTAALLRALQLPPHAQHAQANKIATELAEQASEMCIQSPNSSPLSSHPVQTMQS